MSDGKNYCDKCGKEKKKDHKCKGMPKGSYGLGLRFSNDEDRDEADMVTDANAGDGGGAMGEAVRMPRAPQDSDKQMQGMSSEKKSKRMDEFKAASDAAKKRLGDQKRKDELYKERKTKGVKFYDSKGSGYIRQGKKHYE